MDDAAGDVGQAEVAARVAVGQPLVVEAEEVQERGVQVVVVDLVFYRGEAELVGLAVGDAAFDAAAGEPDRVAFGVVVAAVGALGVGRAAELAPQNTSVSSSRPRDLRSVSRPLIGRSTALAIFSWPLTSFSCWSHR